MNSTVARMPKYGLNQTAKLNANIISLALHLRLGHYSLSASGLHQQVFPVNKVKSAASEATKNIITVPLPFITISSILSHMNFLVWNSSFLVLGVIWVLR